MTFLLDDRWVWDFWLAEDQGIHHLYYLSAPRSLGDPELRHRNATIGHATSTDLVTWTDLGTVLTPGGAGAFDETATWTGSIVRDADGTWFMFYTGSRFLSADATTNVETIGFATSTDLHEWSKSTVEIAADPRWYEVLGDGTWREEAWRDPWVYRDDSGAGWHMLVTARGRSGDPLDRGVIGHATSADLRHWEVQPPVSETGAGFIHLEVPQIAGIGDRRVLLFSCDTAHLAGARLVAGEGGGIWWLPVESAAGPFEVAGARRLTAESFYSGRVVRTASGSSVLLAFENIATDGSFIGRLSDPMPLSWTADGALTIEESK